MDIQPLKESDLRFINELQPGGWPDIVPVINFYIHSNFCYPIKVMVDRRIIGIGTAIVHQDVAWLAHIIVHPDSRNLGVGKRITETLLKGLRTTNCNTVYLIATDLGEPVYLRVGFETETEYLFFKDIKINENRGASDNIVPISENYKNQVLDLDRKVSGESRLCSLEQHLENGFAIVQREIVVGFYLPTFGEGLIIAVSAPAGHELMKLRLTTKSNAAFPVDNVAAKEYLYQNNFKEFKTAKRMRFGVRRSWNPANIYSRIGGNLG